MSENPYTPPESRLDLPELARRESIWWKLFFILSVVLSLLVVAGVALVESLAISIFDYIDSAISLVAMVGLFGFAFSRPIGKPKFWKVFFYLIVVEWLFYSISLPVLGLPRFGEITQFDGLYAIEIVYSMLLFWALYLYAFKREYDVL